MEYKGYIARIEYDDDFKCLCGSVMNSGPYSIVTFVANDVEGLEREFAISIDIYLEACAEAGHTPRKPEPVEMPLSEPIYLQLGESLHERIWQAARDSDQSLDCWVAQALERSLAAETPTPQV
ncbi:MAG: type II toxin-antitoxin system HicB family antitoxin [Anaerolineaceae bacterium]|nr:type II toxin-antitoxin system HicB family antitoxin [Anaerolineaceae bacterium]